jgi:two-component system, sensor histidine kinase and response regulator
VWPWSCSKAYVPLDVPAGADNLIDWNELRERLCDDEELVGTIVDLFVEECPAWLAAVVDAVEAADLERIRASAHSLKGAAGNLSAHSLTAVAGRLESLCREGNLSECNAACAELSAECDRLLHALRQRRVH